MWLIQTLQWPSNSKDNITFALPMDIYVMWTYLYPILHYRMSHPIQFSFFKRTFLVNPWQRLVWAGLKVVVITTHALWRPPKCSLFLYSPLRSRTSVVVITFKAWLSSTNWSKSLILWYWSYWSERTCGGNVFIIYLIHSEFFQRKGQNDLCKFHMNISHLWQTPTCVDGDLTPCMRSTGKFSCQLNQYVLC